jgi:hypothetical protein
MSKHLILNCRSLYHRKEIGSAMWLYLVKLSVRIVTPEAGATTRKILFVGLHHNLPSFFERATRLSHRE